MYTSYNVFTSHVGYPGKIHNLMFTNLANNSVLLKWNAPLNTGGEKINYYVISVAELPSNKLLIQIKTKENKILIDDLNDMEYNVSVQAVNCHGEGSPLFIKVSIQMEIIIGVIIAPQVILLLLVAYILSCLIIAFVNKKRKKLQIKVYDNLCMQRDVFNSITIINVTMQKRMYPVQENQKYYVIELS